MTTPVDTKPEPGPVAVTAIESNQPSRIRRIGRGIWRAFKWLLALAIIAGLAAAIYFGWPEVNRRFIQPIADNTAELNTLEGRLDDTRTQLAELQEQVDAAIAAQGGLPERVAATESSLDELAATVDELAADARSVDRLVSAHTDRLDALEAAAASLAEDQDATATETTRQIGLLRSMELLSRARLFLYQSNFGLAEQDVQAARNLLADLQAAHPDADPALMNEVIFRLDRTLEQLPERPVVAADDLDIAWAVLLGDIEPPAPATEETSGNA